MSCNLNFIGLEPGDYTADITIKTKNGTTYNGGNAAFTVTDKPVLDYAHILNYDWFLTTATESFYVELRFDGLFADYDKIKINLRNRYDEIVAETVEKSIIGLYYDRSNIAYKLKVTQPLEADGLNSYYIEVVSDADLDIVSNASYVRVGVTSEGKFVRAEFINSNTVRIYTENVAPGEYIVTDRNNNNEYNVTINEQGIGEFVPENNGKYSYNFSLKHLDGQEIDGYVYLYTDRNRDYSKCTPDFLLEFTVSIDGFEVEAETNIEYPEAEDIETVNVLQNGEVIAKMTNIRKNRWQFSQYGAYVIIDGKLDTFSGKSFTKGEALVEVKYKNGFVSNVKIPVTDAANGLYGKLKLDNCCNYNKDVISGWASYATGNRNAVFTISDTNATSGKVTLYCDDEAVEELDLSQLTKTVNYGYCYTYKGSFTTTLSSDKIYDVVFDANGKQLKISRLVYLQEKFANSYNNITASCGDGDIYLGGWINISNPENLTFKAVMGGVEYNIPVSVDYQGDDYIDFIGNFSAVPKGYFTLKIYDGQTEVNTDNIVNYNFGNVEKPVVKSSGWKWKNQKRAFGIFGNNLDKATDITARIYKVVDFPESDNSDYSKLEFIKEVALEKPYSSDHATINPDVISDLPSGRYCLAYVIDGKIVENDNIIILGNEPVYKAEMSLNNGIAYTNGSSVDAAITSIGYTKVKFALSEQELENAQYEAISSRKTISLGENEGTVTVYAKFANDDETKSEIVTALITRRQNRSEYKQPHIAISSDLEQRSV